VSERRCPSCSSLKGCYPSASSWGPKMEERGQLRGDVYVPVDIHGEGGVVGCWMSGLLAWIFRMVVTVQIQTFNFNDAINT